MSNYQHGHYVNQKPSSTYISWRNMLARCDNESHPYYHNYGGLDIAYDPRWKSFMAFLEDMGERPVGTTLDRKDNSKDYCKDNCKWSTRTEQARNRTTTKLNIGIAQEIRKLYAEGKLNQRQIGELFDLKTHHISEIVTNKCWREDGTSS